MASEKSQGTQLTHLRNGPSSPSVTLLIHFSAERSFLSSRSARQKVKEIQSRGKDLPQKQRRDWRLPEAGVGVGEMGEKGDKVQTSR